jgi:putative ABC transport system permease protein
MKNYIFELKEGLIISLRALRANKARAVLTTLGIFIGVTSVVLMSTAINGIDGAFQRGISSMGSDVLYIDKWAWFSDDNWWNIRNRKNLTLEDYDKFKDLVKLPIATAPYLWSLENLGYNSLQAPSTIVMGTTAEYLAISNFSFSSGRFFNEFESRGSRNVVVIGSEVAKTLFPNVDPLEKNMKIGGINYKVVGVISEIGSFIMGSFNPDKEVFVPIGTIYKYFLSSNFRSITIAIRAANTAMIPETKEEAEGVMRKVRGLPFYKENDFSVNQQEGLTQQYDQTVGVIKIAGLFITGLSLFVGAIGIMNIMFVSVKERTKEIGIRKAIGAKKRTIWGQFITEATIICLMGGIFGLIGAILLSMIVNQFLPTSVQVDSVVLAIVISIITGLVAGFAPAYTAAKMDPVEALRYE